MLVELKYNVRSRDLDGMSITFVLGNFNNSIVVDLEILAVDSVQDASIADLADVVLVVDQVKSGEHTRSVNLETKLVSSDDYDSAHSPVLPTLSLELFSSSETIKLANGTGLQELRFRLMNMVTYWQGSENIAPFCDPSHRS